MPLVPSLRIGAFVKGNSANMDWKSPFSFPARLSVEGGEEVAAATPPRNVEIKLDEQQKTFSSPRTVSISGFFTRQSVSVRFLQTKKETPLQVTGAILERPGIYRLRGKGTIVLKNASSEKNETSLDLIVIERPNDRNFSVDGLKGIEGQDTIRQRLPRDIKVTPQSDADEDKIVIVTSDPDQPKVTIILEPK